jgi:hypothetical protein
VQEEAAVAVVAVEAAVVVVEVAAVAEAVVQQPMLNPLPDGLMEESC